MAIGDPSGLGPVTMSPGVQHDLAAPPPGRDDRGPLAGGRDPESGRPKVAAPGLGGGTSADRALVIEAAARQGRGRVSRSGWFGVGQAGMVVVQVRYLR